jgi:viroplasmin and RNaseH domain-containing protein
MMGLFSFGQEAQVFFTSAMIRSQIAALSLWQNWNWKFQICKIVRNELIELESKLESMMKISVFICQINFQIWIFVSKEKTITNKMASYL